MTIQPTISIGDICVILGMLAGAAVFFFGVVGQVKAIDYKVEELRRGRGLILRHWPVAVRRCFGFEGEPFATRVHPRD